MNYSELLASEPHDVAAHMHLKYVDREALTIQRIKEKDKFLYLLKNKPLRKKSELYQYNLNVVNKYRKQITENHKALEAHRKQKLLDYGFDLQKTISMYRDAPFNTVKNAGIIRDKEADIIEFYAN